MNLIRNYPLFLRRRRGGSGEPPPAAGLTFTPESLNDLANWSVVSGSGDLSVVDGSLRFTASATSTGAISAPITVDPAVSYDMSMSAPLQTANYIFLRLAANAAVNFNITFNVGVFSGTGVVSQTSLIKTSGSTPNLAYIGVFFEADVGEYFDIDSITVEPSA